MKTINFREEAKKIRNRVDNTVQRVQDESKKRWEKISEIKDADWRERTTEIRTKVEERVSDEYYRFLDRLGFATKEDIQAVEARMQKLAAKVKVDWTTLIEEPENNEAAEDKPKAKKATKKAEKKTEDKADRKKNTKKTETKAA